MLKRATTVKLSCQWSNCYLSMLWSKDHVMHWKDDMMFLVSLFFFYGQGLLRVIGKKMCLRYLQELSLAKPLVCQLIHRIFCTINGFHAINNMNGSFWKLCEWKREQMHTIDFTFAFATFYCWKRNLTREIWGEGLFWFTASENNALWWKVMAVGT